MGSNCLCGLALFYSSQFDCGILFEAKLYNYKSCLVNHSKFLQVLHSPLFSLVVYSPGDFKSLCCICNDLVIEAQFSDNSIWDLTEIKQTREDFSIWMLDSEV